MIGLSSASRSSVILLFGEYCIAIEDPLIFDSVLDLLDSFKAISDYVCLAIPSFIESLPQRDRKVELQKQRTVLMDAVDALKNAFYMRVERAAAKKDDRDTRVQAKGSLNNLLACADSALKCGLCVFRSSQFPGQANSSAAKSRIIGVLGPQLNRTSRVRLGYIPSGQCVAAAIISMDADHLFHPEHLSRILHEVSHLFFEARVCQDSTVLAQRLTVYGNRDNLSVPDVRDSLFVWYSELYAEWFVQVFVFGQDHKSFTILTLLTFENLRDEMKAESGYQTGSDNLLPLFAVEVLFRMYVISHWTTDIAKAEVAVESLSIQDVTDDFFNFVTKFTGYSKTLQAASKSLIQTLCSAVVSARFADLGAAVEIVKKPVIREFEGYYSNHPPDVLDRAESAIKACFENGLPLDVKTHDSVQDELSLVVFVVRRYTQWLVSQLPCEQHDGKCFFDSIDGDFVWTDAEARTQHTRRFAIAMKSLWQISSRQRLRRLIDLVGEFDPADAYGTA